MMMKMNNTKGNDRMFTYFPLLREISGHAIITCYYAFLTQGYNIKAKSGKNKITETIIEYYQHLENNKKEKDGKKGGEKTKESSSFKFTIKISRDARSERC